MIEQEISLGRLEQAARRVKALVERDPFDLRAIQVFAEVHRALAAPQAILDLVQQNEQRLDQFPPLALVYLGDALLSMGPSSSATRSVAAQLLTTAARGRFEEREARRVALSLLKVNNDDEALDFIERFLRDHPDWRNSAAFLQLRGRANLQLAYRCGETAKNGKLPPETRNRAWRDCRRYADRAERDLRDASTHSPEPAVADHIEMDLDKLERLRRNLGPPRRPRRG